MEGGGENLIDGRLDFGNFDKVLHLLESEVADANAPTVGT